MPGEKPKSPTEMLAALDRGEIVRGDKGISTYQLPGPLGDIEVRHSKKDGELSYTTNGVLVKAIIREGTILQLEIFDADTGNTLFDTKNRQKQGELIMSWYDEGHL